MGKKRGRSTAMAKPANGVAAEHSQSLVDDVRQVRDVEFAAEKKEQERRKRRKLTEELELAAAKKAARAMKKAASSRYSRRAPATSRVDARKAGLEMWKKAALRRKTRTSNVDDENAEADLQDEVVDPKTTAKIFKEAKEQRAEVREEILMSVAEEAARNSAKLDNDLRGVGEKDATKTNITQDSDDDSDDDMRSNADTEGGTGMHGEKELEFLDGTKVTEEDEMALALFSNMENKANGLDDAPENATESGPRIMLADIILEKIREKEEDDARAAAIAADPERAERDRKIAEVYGLVGNILSRYRSGKVPKAFKVIPKLRNWEEILYLTRPDEWSPAAVYVATRLLASNLTAKQVVGFYTDILLQRCLEDISENKKLNYHLYRALAKAVYKPDAFNKGILFPLCEDYGCTLRQATIIGSVVSQVSIPMLHSAAALLYICQLPYSPPNSIIITALLEKKYALPYRVLDAVVDSFLKMKLDPRSPPLPWHQSLLSFAQRYKMELTMEQKEKLKLLMRVHTHHAVTPEIRRELFSSRNRGDLMDPDANTIARNIESAAMVM